MIAAARVALLAAPEATRPVAVKLEIVRGAAAKGMRLLRRTVTIGQLVDLQRLRAVILEGDSNITTFCGCSHDGASAKGKDIRKERKKLHSDGQDVENEGEVDATTGQLLERKRMQGDEISNKLFLACTFYKDCQVHGP